MNSTLNILIDSKNFFDRTLYSTNFKDKNSILFTEEDRKIYMQKLSVDFSAFIRRLDNNFKSVIFCMDSMSWRKTEIDFENVGYKKNRKKKKEIDWKGYNLVTNEFIELAKSYGCHVEKENNCEADDLIAKFVEHFKEIGENTMVWSADNDLFQLVYHNSESFNVQFYQPSIGPKVIAATEDFFTWLNGEAVQEMSAEDLVFNMAAANSNFNVTLKNLFKKAKLGERLINPVEILFKKIVGGDSSDCIPKIKSGLGKVFLEKLWSEYYKDSFTMTDSLNEITQLGIVDRVFQLKTPRKFKKGQEEAFRIEREQAERLIQLNVRLIYLTRETAPDNVNEVMQKVVENFNYKKISYNTIKTMQKFLDGTVWYNKKDKNLFTPKGMDPFSNVDTEKYSKPVVKKNALF